MSVKRMIYQIGRFDSSIDEKVNFEIDDKPYQWELSSFALKEYFGEHAKVILVCPVSILLNESVLLNEKALETIRSKESLRSFYEKIKGFVEGKEEEKEKEKEKYIKNPWEYLREHPHSKKANDFIVIPSIGEFLREKFSSPLGNIVLRILIDMIERYKNEPFDEMYLDISSGHNIYTYALVEAGRLFLTLMKLEDFLKEKDIKIFIAITEPIFGKPSPDKRYKIFKDFQLDVKGFFYFPEKPQENSENAFSKYANKLIETIKGKEDRELKRKIMNMLYKAYLFYSALRNNLPLVVYYLCTLEEYRYTENDVKNLLEEIVNLLKQKLDKNLKESPDLNFDDLRKLFMMLGLAMGIIRVLEKHGICKEIKEGVYLRNIEKLFAEEESSIYGYFGLKTNIPYLQQEIQNNFLDEKKRDSITNEWKLLRDIAKLHDESINPRNVVAHCGFEKNITEVKKSDNGDIVIRYTSYYKEPTKEKEKEKKNEYNSLKEIFKEKIVKGVLLEYKHTD
jgi:CRISPR-associated protein Csx1